MSLTVEKLLNDARTLISRLKEQDCNADSILSTSQVLHRRIEAMKQYQDDITELNEMAKHRPRSSLVLGLAQENRRIRELQQEKQELGAALEEHQSALQLIMHKYRQHTVRLLHANRLDATLRGRHTPSKEEVCRLLDKVDEMASVMQTAIRLDDAGTARTQERISRLQQENRTLRQLLEICALPPPPPPSADTDAVAVVGADVAADADDGTPSLAVDQGRADSAPSSSQQGEKGEGVEDRKEEEGGSSKPDDAGSEKSKS